MKRRTFFNRLAGGAAALSLGPGCIRAGNTPAGEIPTRLTEGIDYTDWRSVRSLFPLRRDRVYFNTGGLGPPADMVLEAMREQALEQAENGETFHSELGRVRDVAARFLGGKPEELAFTRNASESNSIVAAGLDLRKGDEVIFESHAHPGGSHPWLVQQKEKGIRVRIFEPSTEDPQANLDRLFDQVNERTRVIQVSHITAPTGILFDVRGIAREARKRGIWFHIDGAQSAGMIPLDLRGLACDSFATSGHKWLNGPQESGILYIARERIDEVACSHAGAYSDWGYELPDVFNYNPTVQRHEYGTRDAAAIRGLEVALLLQEKIGRERIERYGRDLAEKSRMAIQDIPGLEILTPEHPDMHRSILTFRMAGWDSSDLFSALNKEHNLRCRPVSERGLNAVRVSWHVYNQEADIEMLQSALRVLSKS